MSSHPWLEEARKLIGTHEIVGPRHEPKILQMWKSIRRSGIHDDETPWCAAFVGACFEAAGILSTRFESAKSYLTWGTPISEPCYGCVVVFSRNGDGGHVGFVVGESTDGRLAVLGGNQGDMVCVKLFRRDAVVGYRWPLGVTRDMMPLARVSSGLGDASKVV